MRLSLIAVLCGFPVLSGCADGAKAKYDEVSQTDEFKVAKKAWNAFNFATNVANPLYYAQKGAEMGYQKYKESKEGQSSGGAQQGGGATE